jgi:uncharacterized membrane-anchored protein
MTDAERTNAIARLHWVNAGTLKLPLSGGRVALPQGYRMVLGEDARRLSVLSGNPDDSGVEAVVLSPKFEDEIVFQSVNEGYVSLNDWTHVDPNNMIRSILDGTEQANTERRRQGLDEIHVIGWLQEPTLDRQTSTVYWAIEGSTDHGNIVNSIALRLGRNGYERLNWIADRINYASVGGQLDVMLRAHTFEPGFQYADHQPGDKAALYGIAGLVATVAGAKALKAAAGVGLLVVVKKFAAILLGPLAFGLLRLKRIFLRRPPSGPSASHT